MQRWRLRCLRLLRSVFAGCMATPKISRSAGICASRVAVDRRCRDSVFKGASAAQLHSASAWLGYRGDSYEPAPCEVPGRSTAAAVQLRCGRPSKKAGLTSVAAGRPAHDGPGPATTTCPSPAGRGRPADPGPPHANFIESAEISLRFPPPIDVQWQLDRSVAQHFFAMFEGVTSLNRSPPFVVH